MEIAGDIGKHEIKSKPADDNRLALLRVRPYCGNTHNVKPHRVPGKETHSKVGVDFGGQQSTCFGVKHLLWGVARNI